jgi:hypothetical protein
MAETEVLTGKQKRKAAIKAEKAEKPAETKPKGRAPKNQPEGGPTFWQKVAQVAKADWGPRANIYLYRVEPVIDRRRSGSQTYITKYAEPISEDRILADHGSGRYKAMLNFRKPGAEQGDEVDSLYIDLLNLQFPPKIPPGDWVDDPNNKKWAWAKQSIGKEPQQNGGANLVEALEVLSEIQESTRKGVLAQIPQPKSTVDELDKMASFMDKVRPVPAAPSTATSDRMFDMLNTFMTNQLAASRSETQELRAELREIRNKSNPAAGQNGGLSLVKELVGGIKELMPDIKEIVPGFGQDGGGGRQRPWWQEAALLVAPHVGGVIQPFANLAASAIAAKMMQPQPGMNGYQPNPSQPQTGQTQPALPPGTPTMMPFLQMIAFPMVNHVRDIGTRNDEGEELTAESMGKDFALWVFNGYGSDSRYGQAILAARAMGPTGIIAAFRSTPLWSDKGPQQNLVSLAELEPKLLGFFSAFLAFDPNEQESDDEPQQDDPGRPVIVETFSEAGV